MALLSSLPSLAANIATAVILRDLVEDKAGSPMKLHLIRTPPEGQDGLRFYDPSQSVRIPPEMPARPPSSLLSLNLEMPSSTSLLQVSSARDASGPFTSLTCGPALYLSIYRPSSSKSRTAISVTTSSRRHGCYGYFLSEIPPHTKVLGWDRVATTKLPTSILFLERVGGYSPLGGPVPQTVQDDLWSITKDFGELHIFAKDLRYDNVLLAPDSPPGLPSLVSPSSHRSYGLRVVDFDLEYKVNLPPQSLDFHHRHPVRLILDKVPSGNVVNPFDD